MDEVRIHQTGSEDGTQMGGSVRGISVVGQYGPHRAPELIADELIRFFKAVPEVS